MLRIEPVNPQQPTPDDARHACREILGQHQWTRTQAQIIQDVLEARDTLAVLPKRRQHALAYLAAALVLPGVTVVGASDEEGMLAQAEWLSRRRVNVATLTPQSSPAQRRAALERIRTGQLTLAFVTRTLLHERDVVAALAQAPLQLLVVRDAHQLSALADDHHPEPPLVSLRDTLPGVPCLALCELASDAVCDDVRRHLDLRGARCHRNTARLPSVILYATRRRDPKRQTLRFLEHFPDHQGVIYCHSVHVAEYLTRWLLHRHYPASACHRGMNWASQQARLRQFRKTRGQLLVATSDVLVEGVSQLRFMIHYELPDSLERYRHHLNALGQDGLHATSLLLFDADNVDKERAVVVANNQGVTVDDLVGFARTHLCRWRHLLQVLGESHDTQRCGRTEVPQGSLCDHCLPSRLPVDLTVLAQKALSTLARTHQALTTDAVVAALRGEHTPAVESLRLDQLPTFGIGRAYDSALWRQLIDVLEARDLIHRHPQQHILTLRDTARSVLRGEALVHAQRPGGFPRIA